MKTIDGYELIDTDFAKGICLYQAIDAGLVSVRIKGLVVLETKNTRATHHFTDYDRAVNYFKKLKGV